LQNNWPNAPCTGTESCAAAKWDSCEQTNAVNLNFLISPDQKVKLMATDSTTELGYTIGRLEVNIDNTWGTVCGDKFDQAEAAVACKQLG
jgi:hypothetical protein